MRGKSTGELKTEARRVLTGYFGIALGTYLLSLLLTYAIIVVCYMVLVMNVGVDKVLNLEALLTALNEPSIIVLQYILSLIMSLLTGIVMTGYKLICMKITRGEKPAIADLLFAVKNNPDKVIIISLITWVVTEILDIPQTIISGSVNDDMTAITSSGRFFLGFVLMIIVWALILAARTLLFPAYYIYLDNPQLSVKELILGSVKLMKGNILRLISLALSFIGWIFLSVFTFGIALIFIEPYIQVSFAVFYRDIKGEYAIAYNRADNKDSDGSEGSNE